MTDEDAIPLRAAAQRFGYTVSTLRAEATLQEFVRRADIDLELSRLWTDLIDEAAKGSDMDALIEAGLENPKTRHAFSLLGIWLESD